MKTRPPRAGDLVIWKENGDIDHVGILLDVMESRGHYSVIKILMLNGEIALIKYVSEFPEILSEHSMTRE